jgi:hypothetical protein
MVGAEKQKSPGALGLFNYEENKRKQVLGRARINRKYCFETIPNAA